MAIPTINPDTVLGAQQGDEQAWCVLYRTWTPVVIGWCAYHGGSSIDREEAAHESFIRLHRIIGRLRAPESFPSFLYGIVIRVVREHRRSSWWSRWVPVALAERAIDSPSPERRVELTQAARDLEAVLDSLREHHREVMILCRVLGHSHTEAANLLGISPNTVRSRLGRAQKIFDERIRKRGLVTLEAL